ncbi:MAG: UDP-N-acetylglucosamine 1-carboxyvinyltransferase [Candidatus Daviesbacteria bacterium GW2011_GWA1_38_7]|nr:MAG: UDP-N-acetylglucosamine 1-carboxyvinyltransferase [Candidatus Daviesbacteria bacterium GW2011_GWA1_38_7]
MAKYIITGGHKLKGKIRIGGNKNAVLPCLAACLLTDKEVVLHNVPLIRDVGVTLDIFRELGVNSELDGSTIRIRAQKITSHELPKDLAEKLRASILFVGPLLTRLGKAKFTHPGGDIIGKRSIDIHLNGFKDLGYEIKRRDLEYEVSRKHHQNLVNIFLDEPSVTGTENLILAASLSQKVTILRNCAAEPHVVDLCNILVQMGVEIEGIGSSTLRIIGKDKLNGTEFTIGQDFMELGTYSIAAAITGGEIEMENATLDGMEPMLNPLRKFGLQFEEKNGVVKVWAKNLKFVPVVKVNVWPGFPTDVMSLAIVLATQARGVTLCHDWMYEGRMFFVDKLIGMGANITIADPHRVVIYGPSKLTARDLESPDIRAGMALILAALIADGVSTINRAELVERGYQNVVENLTSLGAKIERVD